MPSAYAPTPLLPAPRFGSYTFTVIVSGGQEVGSSRQAVSATRPLGMGKGIMKGIGSGLRGEMRLGGRWSIYVLNVVSLRVCGHLFSFLYLCTYPASCTKCT